MSKRALTHEEIESLLHGGAPQDSRNSNVHLPGGQASGLAPLLQPESNRSVAPEPVAEAEPSAAEVEHCEFDSRAAAALKQSITELARFDCGVAVEPARPGDGHAGDPGIAFAIRVPEADETIQIQIGHDLLFPLISRTLGGGWIANTVPTRSLTDIERRFAFRIVCEIVVALQTAWTESAEPPWGVELLESGETPAGSCPPAVQTRLHVVADDVSGLVDIFTPTAYVESLSRRWLVQNFEPTAELDQPVRLAVNLLETDLPADEVDQLAVGDIISTDHDPDALLDVTLNGIPLLQGRLGSADGHKAVRLV